MQPKTRKNIWVLGMGLVLAAGVYFVGDYFSLFKSRIAPGTNTETTAKNPSISIEEVARGLDTPWSIVFTTPDRMLVSERKGTIRVIQNGILQSEPIHTFAEIAESGEQGLMSLTLDPDYDTNKFVYASFVYPQNEMLYVKIVRLIDAGNHLTDSTVIFDKIFAAEYHAGSRIAFGPDGKLYVTTGDATERGLAQQVGSLPGKILRLNKDGSIPADNPFQNSPVWSYGHRNPQGLAWDAAGQLYSTEHGPSVFDGPAGGDEVNRIVKGNNYGWPLVSHTQTRQGTIAPFITFTPAEAPASLMIYSGNMFPEWHGNLFFGALKGEGIIRLVLNEAGTAVISFEKLETVRFGRIRDVAEGPDGFIYFSTSNRDGRGDPAPADDRIFRIRPTQLI